MKNARQEKILELIAAYPVQTQEELTALLKESGFAVTQATVSRDIRELKLVKVTNQNSISVYHQQALPPDLSERYRQIFGNAVRSVDYSLNNVVIHCQIGTAGAACAALDSMKLDGVLGTIAGDDTIFIVTRNQEISAKITEQLKVFVC